MMTGFHSKEEASAPRKGRHLIYLFSSFTGLPDAYFQGYAFHGSNYISGQEAAFSYRRQTGLQLKSGLDGCYVSVWLDAEGHRLGVDFGGLKKLFLYQHGDVWAVSNSLTAIADHLTDNAVPIRVNMTQLAALRVETTLTTQISCFDTMIDRLRLVPSWCDLVVVNNQVKMVTRPAPVADNYRNTLHDYIETWVRRFETLLTDERVRLSCDLTGGKDSRMVFALVEKARQRLGVDSVADLVYRSGTGARWEKDFVAASRIADHFGFALNSPPRPTDHTTPITGGEQFHYWQALNLGLYFAVYFPGSSINPFAIHTHGGGGGKHRPSVYTYDGFDGFHSAIHKRHKGDLQILKWASTLGADLQMIQARTPEINPWVLHYREFRHRLHAGRSPQYRPVLTPLDGVLPEVLSSFGQNAETSQIHFDVMESLFPGLIDFPYDDPAKGPTADARHALTRIAIDNKPAPGKAFISSDYDLSNRPYSEKSPFDLLLDRFQACDMPRAGELMPTIAANAVDAFNTARALGKFDHASHGKNIARILTADALLRYI